MFGMLEYIELSDELSNEYLKLWKYLYLYGKVYFPFSNKFEWIVAQNTVENQNEDSSVCVGDISLIWACLWHTYLFIYFYLCTSVFWALSQ